MKDSGWSEGELPMRTRAKRTAGAAGRLLISVLLLLTVGSCSGSRPVSPGLVIVLVVDGFRADYYDRFSDLLGEDGLNAIVRNGTSFENARVGHFFSATAPGHATIATGRYPSSHGIIANYWWDRESGKHVVCGEDAECLLLGAGESVVGASPKHLRGDHVVPLFRSRFSEKARIFSVAGKDRSAVMFGAAGADGVFWFSGNSGRFVTSTWYAEEMPGWVGRFNLEEDPEALFGDTWDLLLPREIAARAEPDDRSFEADHLSMGITFPHPLLPMGDDGRYHERFLHSPLVDEHTVSFVLRLIDEEGLGRDSIPDLLLLSLSGLDYVGHLYGPFSLEVADAVWRIDRAVARLRDALAGVLDVEKDVLFVLTSDHGMAPLPEEAVRRGHDAGKVLTGPLPDPDVPVPDVVTLVERTLTASFGDRSWVSSCVYPSVYLDGAAVEESGVPLELVLDTGRKALLDLPGVERVLTRTEIQSVLPADADPVLASVRRWYDPSRAGDLVIHVNPYYILTSASFYRHGGTNHGSVHDYDARIPLVFSGGGVPAGVREDRATHADVLPSLMTLLGIRPGEEIEGRSLF